MTRNFRPREAVERYLKERMDDVSDSTLYNHRSCLRQFISFCEQEEIEDISQIDSFALSDFRIQRSEEVNKNTVYNNVATVRKFIRWCESRSLIEENLADNMILPTRDNASRDVMLEPEQAKEILNYLQKFEYGTLRHALFSLLWKTGIRGGAARAINVDDFSEKGKYISIRHRPEEDTPLKNKEKSERDINLDKITTDTIADYIEARRIEIIDQHGNKPLFTSQQGRLHRTTIRKNIVALTRPCYYSDECPHDRRIDECEATSYDAACKCPSSRSPHPIRRSAITYWLDEGYSKELLSDRMDVSVEVLENHYDSRSEEQKRELRRDMLDIE